MRPQKLTISLAGTEYQLTLKWCVPAACWILDIASATGTAILTGVPLVTGCDLLEQFGYLALGGKVIVQTDNDTDAVPSFQNLGQEGHLYFVAVNG